MFKSTSSEVIHNSSTWMYSNILEQIQATFWNIKFVNTIYINDLSSWSCTFLVLFFNECKCLLVKCLLWELQLNFRKSLYIYSAAAMLVGKKCTPVHFQNPPIFLAHNSAFICANDFKFGTETLCIIVKIIQKLIIICIIMFFLWNNLQTINKKWYKNITDLQSFFPFEWAYQEIYSCLV